MKLKFTMLAMVVMVVIAACQKEDPLDQNQVTEKSMVADSKSQGVTVFKATLSGSQEVHTVNTNAAGHAIFHLSKDGTELTYRLFVNRLHNITMAHIHLAPVGVNGPPVAWLLPLTLLSGANNGLLSHGVIKTGDLVGPLAGEDLSVLIEAIKDGRTYVNVHTTQYPPGEIRGQIY
jgi:hypothetical protein